MWLIIFSGRPHTPLTLSPWVPVIHHTHRFCWGLILFQAAQLENVHWKLTSDWFFYPWVHLALISVQLIPQEVWPLLSLSHQASSHSLSPEISQVSLKLWSVLSSLALEVVFLKTSLGWHNPPYRKSLSSGNFNVVFYTHIGWGLQSQS
jgi:hypothetical protein